MTLEGFIFKVWKFFKSDEFFDFVNGCPFFVAQRQRATWRRGQCYRATICWPPT